jgi:hypothetical protein
MKLRNLTAGLLYKIPSSLGAMQISGVFTKMCKGKARQVITPVTTGRNHKITSFQHQIAVF